MYSRAFVLKIIDENRGIMKKKYLVTLLVSSLLMTSTFAEKSIDFQKLLNERDITKVEQIIQEDPSNGEAVYTASVYYSIGDDEIGTNKNETKQLEYLKRAADLKYPEAELQYGFTLLNQGNAEEGLSYLTKSAGQNYMKAISLLGDLYFAGYQDAEGGEVVAQDVDKAIVYLTKAADDDDPDARYTLGYVYLSPELGYQDVHKALELFEKNIDYDNEIGHLPTLIALIDLYTEAKVVEVNRAKQVDYYYLASLQDYLPASYIVGLLQQTGEKGEKFIIEKDFEASFANLQKASLAGYIDAMFRVGEMFFKGEGVPQSDIAAYVWIAIAEELSGKEDKYSETILELIPKRQRQTAIDNKNHYRKFYSMPAEGVSEVSSSKPKAD